MLNLPPFVEIVLYAFYILKKIMHIFASRKQKSPNNIKA